MNIDHFKALRIVYNIYRSVQSLIEEEEDEQNLVKVAGQKEGKLNSRKLLSKTHLLAYKKSKIIRLNFNEDRTAHLQTISYLISNTAITATNWCIFDSSNSRLIGVREDHQREVASLTKIMTTLISLELFERYKMQKDVFVRISQGAAAHSGTSAELKVGKYIKIQDLFYGAMLPSGNDAAYLLAETFGLLLFYESLKPESKDYSQIESIDISCYDSTTTFISKFLKEMNRKAKQLGMTKTSFTNPHGLANVLNVSSAKDLLILSRYSYENQLFRKIVNCEQYRAQYFEEDMQKTYCLKVWKNTNKLLSLGWEGIKTGQTQPAGACLASVRQGIFIIVLNSANKDSRFEDTLMLWDWYQNSQQQKE